MAWSFVPRVFGNATHRACATYGSAAARLSPSLADGVLACVCCCLRAGHRVICRQYVIGRRYVIWVAKHLIEGRTHIYGKSPARICQWQGWPTGQPWQPFNSTWNLTVVSVKIVGSSGSMLNQRRAQIDSRCSTPTHFCALQNLLCGPRSRIYSMTTQPKMFHDVSRCSPSKTARLCHSSSSWRRL